MAGVFAVQVNFSHQPLLTSISITAEDGVASSGTDLSFNVRNFKICRSNLTASTTIRLKMFRPRGLRVYHKSPHFAPRRCYLPVLTHKTIIIIMGICKAPTLRLKALNKYTHIMYIEMENVIKKQQQQNMYISTSVQA